MKYLDEYRDEAAGEETPPGNRAPPRRGRGPSWRSAAARPTRSSSTASTAILPTGSNWCTARAARYASPPGDDRPAPTPSPPGPTSSSAPSATCCVSPARAATSSAQVAGRRRARRLLAARRRQPGRGQPGPPGGVLRHRLRDHRAAQRHGRVARPGNWASRNFSLLVSHVLVPPAMTAILQSPDNRVQGFLGPGHVCTVMGCREYEPISRSLPGADRDHRLRAARHARRRAAGGAAARSRPRRGGKPVQSGRAARGQRRRLRSSSWRSSRSATASGGASA